jgi:hypothetical protein
MVLQEDLIVYRGPYDRTHDFGLREDGAALSLESVTQIDINIGGVTVVSTNQPSDLVRWEQQGYSTGEVRCFPGRVPGIQLGWQPCWLIIYDPTLPNGVPFGPIELDVQDIP